MQLYHDVIIVGAGLAGLRAAVELAGSADIAVVSKVFPTRSIPALPRAALPQHWATRERTAGNGTCMTR
jgi:aspartate oxidase